MPAKIRSLPHAVARRIRRGTRRLRRIMSTGFTYAWRTLMFRTTVIAITGSVGKTTAKECLASVLDGHGRTLRTFQNQNDVYGLPRTIRAMRPWHRYAVVEVGTNGPGDIRRMARLLRPDVAVVLSVARTHTNRFLTLEDTAAEKAALLEFVSRRGLVLLNADDPRVAAMADRCRARVRLFGTGAACDYRASAVESRWPERLRFVLDGPEGNSSVSTQLVGNHWVASVLSALAAAHVCGVPIASACERLAEVPPFMGRMQPVALPSGAVLMRDEETGSIDSFGAMVSVLAEARTARRALVFSDLSDATGNTRKRLRNAGAVAAEHCDFAVFVGGHAHHAVKGALAAGMNPDACRDFVSLEDAARWLATTLREGDLVFLKGRTTDHLSRILFAQFGRIGCWRHPCAIRRLCDVCPQLRPEFDLDEVLNRSLPASIHSYDSTIEAGARA